MVIVKKKTTLTLPFACEILLLLTPFYNLIQFFIAVIRLDSDLPGG